MVYFLLSGKNADAERLKGYCWFGMMGIKGLYFDLSIDAIQKKDSAKFNAAAAELITFLKRLETRYRAINPFSGYDWPGIYLELKSESNVFRCLNLLSIKSHHHLYQLGVLYFNGKVCEK